MAKNPDPAENESRVEFSEEERRRLRVMLTSHERAVWLWSSIGVWAKWIGSVMAGAAALHVAFQQVKEWLK